MTSPRSRDLLAVPPDAAADFFTHASELLAVLGIDGAVRHANPALARAAGWAPDAPAPGHFASCLHPDDRGALAAAWAGIVAGRPADGLVLRLHAPGRPDRWIAWRLRAADAGDAVHVLGHEMTEGEAAGRALRESEARWAHVVAHLPGVVYQFVYRPDGSRGYTYMSEGARALLGIAPADALADPQALVRRIHPDEVAHFRALVREATRPPGALRWEGRIVLDGGEERFVQLAAVDVRQPDGTVVSDGLITDITALRHATRRLEEGEQRYRSLFSHHPDAVFSMDLDLRYTSANPACEALTGYTEAELVAGMGAPFIVPEDREAALAAFRASCEGRAVRVELGMRHRSGAVVRIAVTNVPIVVGGRVAGVFGIAKDLSTHHALEERLRHAQKMEAVGQLAGGIAHDFNNLLMVIQSFGGFVARALPDASPARADLAEVLRAATRAQELTQQLLAFGRKQMLRPRRLDPNVKITTVARMLERVIGEDIALVTDLAPAPWPIEADAGQIEQVLMNLAVNARDAMPHGGRLRLATENRHVRPATPGCAQGPYVALIVEDTGVGITPDVLPHVFEPFFTTKPVGRGTGLGLATVYGIVEQSGGCVTVESAPGQGSRFTVLLPAVDASRAGPGPDAPAPAPAGAETILVVEDAAQLRAAVRRLLEQQGYTVREAATGAEALRMVEAAGGRSGIHLVLTDLVMPEVGGLALGEQLAARWPDLPVLYMSGYPGDEVARRRGAGGSVSFIEKPFTGERLARVVRDALDGAAG